MENASKALIIVASTIIAIMVLMIMLYLFQLSSSVPQQYEYVKQEEMILAYNAKFERYILSADENNDGKISFDTDPDTEDELSNPSNTFANIMSACNLAFDINSKNDNDEKNCVIIDFEIEGDDYCVYPKKDANGKSVLKKDYVFKCKSEDAKGMHLDDSDMVSLLDLMEQEIDATNHTKLSDAKYWEGNKIRYRYYFDAVADYGIDAEGNAQNFGRIVSLKFTMVETEDFDTIS